MVWLGRMALATVGLLGRATLGFIGLAILIGWNAQPPEPTAAAASRPGEPARSAITVTLRLPEGALANHLSVVDGSGRALASLTQWRSGMTSVVSGCGGGAGVSYHLNADGSANLRVDGTARATVIRAETEGTARVLHKFDLAGDDPGTMRNTEGTDTGAGRVFTLRRRPVPATRAGRAAGRPRHRAGRNARRTGMTAGTGSCRSGLGGARLRAATDRKGSSISDDRRQESRLESLTRRRGGAEFAFRRGVLRSRARQRNLPGPTPRFRTFA